MTQVEHGFDLNAIRDELNGEDWEDDLENRDTEVRRIYLGSVFSLTPSGKMYAPFACSNVMGCDVCHGQGTLAPTVKRRVYKRRVSRRDRTHRIAVRLLRGFVQRDEYGHVPTDIRVESKGIRAWRKANALASLPGCLHCGGLGSREAHLDELWNEAAERAIESVPSKDGSMFMSWEDGDAFAVESRCKAEESEE